LGRAAYNKAMTIRVDVNKLNTGKVQIAAFRGSSSSGFVLNYPSPKEAREALIALGFPTKELDNKFEILSELGPKEVLHFTPREISDEILASTGFRI
jgi:hypothetical protein